MKLPDFTNKKYVLVANEKHGERYFDATSLKDFSRSVLYLLTERYEADYWYYPPEKPERPVGLPGADDINNMPDGEFKSSAKKLLARHISEKKIYERKLADYNDIIEAVKNQNVELAWGCLINRSGWEYERISLEAFETLED